LKLDFGIHGDPSVRLDTGSGAHIGTGGLRVGSRQTCRSVIALIVDNPEEGRESLDPFIDVQHDNIDDLVDALGVRLYFGELQTDAPRRCRSPTVLALAPRAAVPTTAGSATARKFRRFMVISSFFIPVTAKLQPRCRPRIFRLLL
jgi:hypothetical protein